MESAITLMLLAQQTDGSDVLSSSGKGQTWGSICAENLRPSPLSTTQLDSSYVITFFGFLGDFCIFFNKLFIPFVVPTLSRFTRSFVR